MSGLYFVIWHFLMFDRLAVIPVVDAGSTRAGNIRRFTQTR